MDLAAEINYIYWLLLLQITDCYKSLHLLFLKITYSNLHHITFSLCLPFKIVMLGLHKPYSRKQIVTDFYKLFALFLTQASVSWSALLIKTAAAVYTLCVPVDICLLRIAKRSTVTNGGNCLTRRRHASITTMQLTRRQYGIGRPTLTSYRLLSCR